MTKKTFNPIKVIYIKNRLQFMNNIAIKLHTDCKVTSKNGVLGELTKSSEYTIHYKHTVSLKDRMLDYRYLKSLTFMNNILLDVKIIRTRDLVTNDTLARYFNVTFKDDK